MSPKTVTCVICNETVTKAQTLQIKEGRACRKHEGVEDFSKQQQQSQKDELLKSIEKRQEKYKPKQYEPKVDLVLKPTCFRCGSEGINVQDFYFQCAVAMEKIKLSGTDINFFELPSQIKQHIPKEFQNPIIMIDITNKPEVIEKIKYKFREICSLARFVALCPKCMKDLKLEQSYREQVEKRRPKLDLQTMHLIGTMMQPELEKIAKEQLKQEGIEIK